MSDNIHCGYSLEGSHPDASFNEYHQNIFSWRNRRNIHTFNGRKCTRSVDGDLMFYTNFQNYLCYLKMMEW